MSGMLGVVLGAVALAPLIAGGAAAAEGPSFDCSKAASWVERQVCADGLLAGLDRDLAAAYGRAREAADAPGRETLRGEQRAWAADRGACERRDAPAACLEAAYRERLAQLAAAQPTVTPRPSWLSAVPGRLAEIDRCLAAIPAAAAVVSGLEALPAGQIEVRLLSPTGRSYDCLTVAGGHGLAAVQDATDATGEDATVFTRAAAPPDSPACRAGEALRGPDGTALGWVLPTTCLSAGVSP